MFKRLLQSRTVAIALLWLSIGSSNSAVLSGAILFNATDSGAPVGRGIWDTLPSTFSYKLWFTTGSPGGNPNSITNRFLNGPELAYCNIAIPLASGTNQLTFFCENSSGSSYMGLNLFFNNHLSPDISLFVPVGASDISPNNAPSTPGMDGTNYPGAGTLQFEDAFERVLMTGFQIVSAGDRVSPYYASPNGVADFLAWITVVVLPKAQALEIRFSQVDLCWDSPTNAVFQVMFRSSLTTNLWSPLGNLVSGSGRLCLQDAVREDEPHRFYQVIKVE